MYQEKDVTSLVDYWKGIRDAVLYLEDMGIDGVSQTKLTEWVLMELGEEAFDRV